MNQTDFAKEQVELIARELEGGILYLNNEVACQDFNSLFTVDEVSAPTSAIFWSPVKRKLFVRAFTYEAPSHIFIPFDFQPLNNQNVERCLRLRLLSVAAQLRLNLLDEVESALHDYFNSN